MHMADALLAPAVAATMFAASGAVVGVSVKELKKDENMAKLPTMAVTAALVFAGQMINYTIPGTGSSGHLCGGMLLSALLGPQAGFLSMAVILAIQALFFADGGLLALGANCWNMAFYGCFIGYYLIWKPIMHSRLFDGKKNADRIRIALASVLGCVITLQMGAFSVVLETTASGITELPFGAFAGIMQPIHLAIGLVEGLITTAVLLFIYEARPELLTELSVGAKKAKSRCSLKMTVAILASVVVMVGGGLSLFASGNPDGLEWSMFGNSEAGYSENMALDEDAYGISSKAADTAGMIQEKTAFLPDYAFTGSDSAAGTTVSGLVGSAIVAAVAVLICMLGGFFRTKRINGNCEDT
ncbi:MAG: energy-coupling factor ABC transporter permease [bacterium]|nr:energy-coupling factor ABC transporter permease [bacterium]MDY4099889.1 energy-coupling factor ABC transporter permease [Lachnospiraceae bacterium]